MHATLAHRARSRACSLPLSLCSWYPNSSPVELRLVVCLHWSRKRYQEGGRMKRHPPSRSMPSVPCHGRACDRQPHSKRRQRTLVPACGGAGCRSERLTKCLRPNEYVIIHSLTNSHCFVVTLTCDSVLTQPVGFHPPRDTVAYRLAFGKRCRAVRKRPARAQPYAIRCRARPRCITSLRRCSSESR